MDRYQEAEQIRDREQDARNYNIKRVFDLLDIKDEYFNDEIPQQQGEKNGNKSNTNTGIGNESSL